VNIVVIIILCQQLHNVMICIAKFIFRLVFNLDNEGLTALMMAAKWEPSQHVHTLLERAEIDINKKSTI